MTPTETEKRVLIAEACGFERQHPIEGVPVWKKPGHPLSPVECLPDYFHSLDACAEMAASLRVNGGGNAYRTYAQKVENLMAIENSKDGADSMASIDAPAWIRCEAFAEALDLW